MIRYMLSGSAALVAAILVVLAVVGSVDVASQQCQPRGPTGL